MIYMQNNALTCLRTHFSKNNKWPLLIRINSCTLKIIDCKESDTISLHEQITERQNKISFRLFVLSRGTSRQNEEMEFHFFVCSFCRVGQGAKNEQTTEHKNKISFLRLFVLSRYTSRQNEEMELHFFVLSRWSRRQYEQTTERKNKISFLRLFVLSRCTSRQNEEMDFISSFVRFVAFPTARWNDKTTKLPRNIKVWFCSFCRLFVLSTSTRRQNDRTTMRQNEVLRPFRFVVCSFYGVIQVAKRRNEVSFWRFFDLSPSIRRQNEQTKWPYPLSIEYR